MAVWSRQEAVASHMQLGDSIVIVSDVDQLRTERIISLLLSREQLVLGSRKFYRGRR